MCNTQGVLSDMLTGCMANLQSVGLLTGCAGYWLAACGVTYWKGHYLFTCRALRLLACTHVGKAPNLQAKNGNVDNL